MECWWEFFDVEKFLLLEVLNNGNLLSHASPCYLFRSDFYLDSALIAN